MKLHYSSQCLKNKPNYILRATRHHQPQNSGYMAKSGATLRLKLVKEHQAFHEKKNSLKKCHYNPSKVNRSHTHLTHSFLITKEPSPVCSTCNKERMDQIITRCPKYAEAQKMFKNSTSLRLALSKDSEAIYKLFHHIHLNHKL